MHRIAGLLGFLAGSFILCTRPSADAAWLGASLPLCVVIVWCASADRNHAILGALWIGLLVDAASSCPTGTHAMVFAVAAAFTWEALQFLLHEKWTAQMLVAGGVTFTCSISVQTLLLLAGRPSLPLDAVYRGAAKEAAANGLFLPLLYWCVGRTWDKDQPAVYRIRGERD